MSTDRSKNAEYQRKHREKSKADAPHTQAQQIAAEIEESYRVAKERLESGLKDLMPGSNAHVKVVTAIADLERARRDELASRGIVPSLLGGARKQGFWFVCHVGAAGTVHTSAYDTQGAFEQALIAERAKRAEGEKKLGSPERKKFIEELENEYGAGDEGHAKKDGNNG